MKRLLLLAAAFLFATAQAVADANISITPATRGYDRTGGTGAINTAGSGMWTASSSVSWISVKTLSGTAGFAVAYTVSENPSVERRTGYVYVSGNVHEVVQTGVGASLESYEATCECDGGTGSVGVSAPAGNTWHAQSNVDWIRVESATGTGAQNLSYTVAAYDEVSTRSGTLTVADNTFTVMQTGRRMKLTSEAATLDYLEGTVKIRVNALADTAWSVSSPADWVTVMDAGSGCGGGLVTIRVAENPNYNARNTTLTIGTESFRIDQLGRTDLVFRITPSEFESPAEGTTGERVIVTATPGLTWSAAGSADWIEVYSNYRVGAGDGSVSYKVKPNPTLLPRTGTLTVTAGDSHVAAKRVEISQAAAEASLTLDGYEFVAGGESLAVAVNTEAIVKWQVANPLSWITVEGVPSAGPATLTLKAAPNPTVFPRSGTLTIAGCVFRVDQKGRGVAIDATAKVFDTDGKTQGVDAENVITVTAESDVSWTAEASDPSWIVIYEGKTGCGNGLVKYVVAPYVGGGEMRQGTITIGDQTVYITQRPYNLSIEPNGTNVVGNAGAGEIQVALDIDGVWDAIATAPWITVVKSYDPVTRSGRVDFTYTDNATGKERVGKIVISGTEYTLTQQARQIVAIATESEGGGHVIGGGTYMLGTQATLMAVADEGYAFAGWTLPGGGLSLEPTLEVTASAAVSYKARFTPINPNLRIASACLRGVTLTWTDLVWAEEFRVWRGTSSVRESATLIATVTVAGAVAYCDATGVENQAYWYWVEAVGGGEDVWSGGLSAKREKKRFGIAYANLRGTTHENPSSYLEGTPIELTPPSAMTGYTFVGWSPAAITAESSGDQVLTAIWRQNTYVVRFEPEGAAGTMADESFLYGFWKYLTPTNYTFVDGVFLGWATEQDGPVVYADQTSVKNLSAHAGAVVPLYAQWRAFFHPTVSTLTVGEANFDHVSLAWTPLAWATSYKLYRSETDTKPSVALATLGRRTLSYADTSAVAGKTYRYWLEAVCDEGTTVAGPESGDRLSRTLPGEAVAALGSVGLAYTQGGSTIWKVSGADAHDGVSALTTGTLAAGETNSLTTVVTGPGALSFWWKTSGRGDFVCMSDGATVAETTSNTWQQVTLTWLTNRQYQVAWRYVQGATGSVSDVGALDEIVWTPAPKTVTVTFEPNGGTCPIVTRDYATGAAYGDFPTPSRPGYQFAGWFTATTGGVCVDVTTFVPLANQTLQAHWTANTYAVRFAANGGVGAVDDETLAYEEERTLPQCRFTRTGYEFAGWSRRDESTTPVLPVSSVVSNLTVTQDAVVIFDAQWDVINYTITYAETRDCANVNPTTYTVEDEIAFSALTAPEGWQFLGWSPAAIAKGTTGDKTVTAQFAKLQYAVTFDLGTHGKRTGGGALSQTIEWGCAAVAPTVRAFGGYAFRGWSAAFDCVKNGMTVMAEYEEVRGSVVSEEIAPSGAEDFVATTYDGYLCDEKLCVVVGTIQVKAAKAKNDKKSGKMETALTITVQLADEPKKISIKGNYDLGLAGEQSFVVKNRGNLVLLLGSNGLSGSFEGYVIEGMPNVYSAKDPESKAAASAADAAYVGVYNVIADEGSFTVTVAKKGKVKITGTTAAGKKLSVSTQLIVGNDVACVPVMAPKVGMSFAVWLGDTPRVDGLTDAIIGSAGILRSGARFTLDAAELADLVGDVMYAAYFPASVPVEQSGSKWIVAGGAKAGKVVLNKEKTGVDSTKLGDNPSSLKLTYKAKTGAFKGSFKAYVNNKGKPKAVAVNVTGVLINGVGYGTASVKSAGSIAITVEPTE